MFYVANTSLGLWFLFYTQYSRLLSGVDHKGSHSSLLINLKKYHLAAGVAAAALMAPVGKLLLQSIAPIPNLKNGTQRSQGVEPGGDKGWSQCT